MARRQFDDQIAIDRVERRWGYEKPSAWNAPQRGNNALDIPSGTYGAGAASGQVAAAPPTNVMNSERLMALPRPLRGRHATILAPQSVDRKGLSSPLRHQR